MPSLSSDFSETLHQVFLAVPASDTRRLLLMTTLGEFGAGSLKLLGSFRALGLVHLLILSGAQVRYFSRGLELAFLWMVPRTANELIKRLSLVCFLAWALWIYGRAAEWPVSLTRAILAEGVFLLMPRLRWDVSLLTALAAQALIFPAHLLSPGFYLSWGAVLVLRLLGQLRWTFSSKIILLSFLSQLAGIIGLGRESPSLRQFVLILGANLSLGWFFKREVMPLLGWATAGAFLVAALGGKGVLAWVGPVLGTSLGGASSLVLVGVKAFGYIQ